MRCEDVVTMANSLVYLGEVGGLFAKDFLVAAGAQVVLTLMRQCP